MTGETECVIGCGRPARDGFACRGCTAELLGEVRRVPELSAELAVNRTRRNRAGSPTGVTSRSAGQPLPFDQGAADAMADMQRTLRKWVLSVAIHQGEALTVPHGPSALAEWLCDRADAVRVHPDARALYADVGRVLRCGWRVVDRKPGRVYLGPCGAATATGTCPADVYARADPHRSGVIDPRQSVVRCECGARWDASERRDWLLAELRETLATAREIASSAGILAGRSLNVKTIRSWANQGRIATLGRTTTGLPLHKIGEVIEVAAITPVRTRVGHSTTPVTNAACA